MISRVYSNAYNLFCQIEDVYHWLSPLTAEAPLKAKLLKPHCYTGIGSFLNYIKYFDNNKVKLFFNEAHNQSS